MWSQHWAVEGPHRCGRDTLGCGGDTLGCGGDTLGCGGDTQKCKCKCHAAVISGLENSGTDGCTDTQCRCGKMILGHSSSNSSNRPNSFGRMDHNTVFRPIIPSYGGSQQLQDSQKVLSDSFNILSLQHIRTDSLDSLNCAPTHRQTVASSSTSNSFPSQESSSTNYGKFMTPQDFLNSYNRKSVNPPASIHSSDSTFPDSTLPGTSEFSINSTATASRLTPLTVEDLTSRLITPDEFLRSSQLATKMQTSGAGEKNVTAQEANVSEFIDTNNARNGGNSSAMISNKLPAKDPGFKPSDADGRNDDLGTELYVPRKKEKSDNPLSEFCSKIGVIPDHNQLLPTIPGGENIKQRLKTPSPDVLENLKKEYPEEAGVANVEETKPVNQPVVLLKEMPYKNSGNNKPFMAIFWDIENCHVPRRKDANSIVRLVRDKFCGQHIEYEFYVVMDVHKEKEELSRDLLRAQVTVVHMSKGEKNAADEKLMYLMRRYATYHQYGHTCILISGDTNFTPVLHDMRHKHHINIILLHNNNANEQLKNTAHFTYNFSFVTDDAPTRPLQYQPPRPQREMAIELLWHWKKISLYGSRIPSLDMNLLVGSYDTEKYKFFICEIHWGADPPLIKLRGGSMRPGIPPSIFNMPASCLPSPKPASRPAKVEDQQLRYFLQKDKITSFDAFKPERNLQK
ncbi:NYN domain limkain-b1-type [Trinorchestia longiramus]|nr:NYN domain limkain-b1-type [Trinorchestia longiramus]